MTMLLWETAALLLGAYFLGAMFGCMTRRLMFPGTLRETAAEPVVQTAAPVAAAAASPTTVKFHNALTGDGRQADQSAPALEPVAPRIEQIEPIAARTAEAPQSFDAGAATAGVAAAGAAVAGVAQAFGTAAPPPQTGQPDAERIEAVAFAGPAPGPADDLENIYAIDTALASALKERGLMRYADIANLDSAQVGRLDEALGLGGRISSENWIEQAEVLAAGGATAYSAGRAMGDLSVAFPAADTSVAREIVPPAPPPEPDPAPIPAAPPPIASAPSEPLEPTEPPREPEPTPAPPAAPVVDDTARQNAAAAAAQRVMAMAPPPTAPQAAEASVGAPPPEPPASRDSVGRTWEASDLGKAGIAGAVSAAAALAATARSEAQSDAANVSAPAPSPEPDPDPAPEAERSDTLASQIATIAPIAGGAAAVAAFTADDEPPAVEPVPEPAALPIATPEPAPDAAAPPNVLRSVRSSALPGLASDAAFDQADDLKRIRGIGIREERKLIGRGVTTYAQIADWTADDVDAANADLGEDGRVQRDNWIEQARMLASGTETSFARRHRLEALGTAVQATPLPAAYSAPPPAPEAEPVAEIEAPSPPPATVPELEPQLEPEPEPAPSLADQIATIAPLDDDPAPVPERDDTPDDTSALGAATGLTGVAAAIAAAAGPADPPQTPAGEDDTSLAPPPPPSTSGSELRSVRSAALTSGGNTDPAGDDDLKRVRGIGVLIERRLNAMGVTRYEQIANWTNQDIDYFSTAFDFRGRIERERWVEQARILASGGSTEFSSRIDNNEF
ncbi:MAG: hypothetical protein AAFQ45_09555 [Pseudomonadota bacterium]